MELNAPILQVVGYQNCGKTTLICRLIEKLSEKYRVATLKHHGHGGSPDLNEAKKDSGRYRKAGAHISGVEGAGSFNLYANHDKSWELDELLKIYQILPLDIILVEGYKLEDYPKVVLLRSEQDESLIEQLTNIISVITWHKDSCLRIKNSRIFNIDEEEQYINWLVGYCKEVIGLNGE